MTSKPYSLSLKVLAILQSIQRDRDQVLNVHMLERHYHGSANRADLAGAINWLAENGYVRWTGNYYRAQDGTVGESFTLLTDTDENLAITGDPSKAETLVEAVNAIKAAFTDLPILPVAFMVSDIAENADTDTEAARREMLTWAIGAFSFD